MAKQREAGNTFVSVNFAAVMAAYGVAELVADTLSFEQVVRRNILPNLDFISTGVLPANPNLLLLHSNMKLFLQSVS